MRRSQEEILELMDKLLDDWEAANDKFDRSEWSKKYGERFGQYSDKLKALNGDDFDIVNASYDEYHNDYKDLNDDEYADALEDNIKKILARVWPEAPEEVKKEVAETVAEEAGDAAKDGAKVEAHVEAEDNDGNGEISKDEVETHTLEEKPEEEEITSDARSKRVAKMKSSWTGSPHTSGGRDGTTSDEEAKKPVEEVEEKDELADFIKDLEDYKAKHSRG